MRAPDEQLRASARPRPRSRGLPSSSPSQTHLGVDAEHRPVRRRRPTEPCRRHARAASCPAPRRSRARRPRTGTRSCSRIARRCGDVDARMSDAHASCARPRSPRTATSSPTRPSRRRSSSCVSASAGAWISISRSISKPFARSRSIHSPCGRWNSTPLVRPLEAVHAELRVDELGRRRHLVDRAEDHERSSCARNTSRPPGRSSRAASGIQRYGSTQIEAPYSETTRSKLASGSPVSAGVRLDERELDAGLVHHAVARSRAAPA